MSTSIKRHTLGKAEKLKSRKQVQKLFAEGKAFTAFPLRVVFVESVGLAPGKESQVTGDAANEKLQQQRMPVQIGVSVSSRNFKHAADRNRIKRLLREVYRVQKHELTEACSKAGKQLDVFFVYVDKQLPDHAGLEDKMRYCLKRLRKNLEVKA
jgi:ribonuclease P protein component